MIAAVLTIALAVQAPGPSDDFERGKNAFDRGEYKRAIELLRPLLYPDIRLESEGELVQTHRMLGVAHLFEKQNARASQEFRKLLQLRPDYRMDPLLDSPQVVDFFNGVLRDYEAEVGDLDTRRKEAEQAEKRRRDARYRAENPAVEKRYLVQSFAVNFIPFGAGQFQNGDRLKGWGFLITQGALASVSVGALATNLALYGFRPKRRCIVSETDLDGDGHCPGNRVIDRTDENRSRMLTRVQVVSGGLFFAAVAWGIADAILHHEPQVPDVGVGPEDRASRRVDVGSRLRLYPLVAKSAVGTGISLRF